MRKIGVEKEVKLETIANELNVSVVTVSNAINGRKGVSEKTREKILNLANEKGYIINNESNKKITSYRIGVIVSEKYVRTFMSFHMDIYKHIAKFADQKGHLTIIEVIDDQKESLVNPNIALKNLDINGIILIGYTNAKYVNHLKENFKIPIVCVDFYGDDEDLDYFVADNYNGSFLLTEQLIKAGHKNIGFVGNYNATGAIMDRYMGYLKALREYKIEYKDDIIINDNKAYTSTVEPNIKLPKNMPSAFVCNNDKTAIYLIQELYANGFSVPDDVSVVGFNKYCNIKIDGIELTTYENDIKALAKNSLNRLMKRINYSKEAEGIRIIRGKIISGNTIKNRGHDG